MKVEIIAKYNDRELVRPVEEGEVLEVTAERAAVLVEAGVAKKKAPAKKAKKNDESTDNAK